MTRARTKSGLTEYDVDLIFQILCWARHCGMTVAEAARGRLAENKIDLRGYRRELRSGPRDRTAKTMEVACDRLEHDSRRIRRLMRMFASWRMDAPDTNALRERSHHE